jgi:hypothetical protein
MLSKDNCVRFGWGILSEHFPEAVGFVCAIAVDVIQRAAVRVKRIFFISICYFAFVFLISTAKLVCPQETIVPR